MVSFKEIKLVQDFCTNIYFLCYVIINPSIKIAILLNIEKFKSLSIKSTEKSTQKEEKPTSGEQKSSAENENMDIEDLAAEHSENVSKPSEIEG